MRSVLPRTGGAELHRLHCRRINARREKYIQRVKKVVEEKVAVKEENEQRKEGDSPSPPWGRGVWRMMWRPRGHNRLLNVYD